MPRTKKNSQQNGVRDRVPSLSMKKGGKEPKRVPGKVEDYLAAQLHEERSKVMDMRKIVLQKENEILILKQENLKLQLAVVNAEQQIVNKANADLRERHSLTVGGSIHMDDETGEVYRLESEE